MFSPLSDLPIFCPPLLAYAEIHYKFKLPWSPLHRKLPEIHVDGPSFCVPGKTPQFYLAIKDAHLYPINIREVAVHLRCSKGQSDQIALHSVSISTAMEFIPLSIDFKDMSGKVQINARISLEGKKGRLREFLNHNLPGLNPQPLTLDLLHHTLPYPSGWQAGEVHCHSNYSSDPVEYGAPLAVMQSAADSLGLGYVLCTDHSYDFYYDTTEYMREISPRNKWQRYSEEISSLNKAGRPLMIAGEEVSCANRRGENVHLLVAGHPEFLAGQGDGGRRWFNNRPEKSIGEILEQIGSTPCFAAHPKSPMGWLERKIFRRGYYHSEDVQWGERHLSGLQFWNGTRGLDYSRGRAFWVQELLKGNKVLPIAANDAHGDLNSQAAVKIPLLSLRWGTKHVFGVARTLVYNPENTLVGFHHSIHAEQVSCSDGPFAEMHMEKDSLHIYAKSNSDFGELVRAHLFAGKKGDTKETLIKSWKWESTNQWDEKIKPESGQSYYRLEVWTKKEKLALTAPVYL